MRWRGVDALVAVAIHAATHEGHIFDDCWVVLGEQLRRVSHSPIEIHVIVGAHAGKGNAANCGLLRIFGIVGLGVIPRKIMLDNMITLTL